MLGGPRPFHKTVFPYTEINTEPIEGSVTEIRKNTEIDTEEYGSKYGSIRLPYFLPYSSVFGQYWFPYRSVFCFRILPYLLPYLVRINFRNGMKRSDRESLEFIAHSEP